MFKFKLLLLINYLILISWGLLIMLNGLIYNPAYGSTDSM